MKFNGSHGLWHCGLGSPHHGARLSTGVVISALFVDSENQHRNINIGNTALF